MARQRRIEYEGAFYHVLARGNRRERIIDGTGDAELFCKTLAEVCLKTGWRVHACVPPSGSVSDFWQLVESRWLTPELRVKFNMKRLPRRRCSPIPAWVEGPGFRHSSGEGLKARVIAGWMRGNHTGTPTRYSVERAFSPSLFFGAPPGPSTQAGIGLHLRGASISSFAANGAPQRNLTE